MGIHEEADLILGIWGANTKYFLGAENFQGFGEINAFLGSKGAKTPLGPQYACLCLFILITLTSGVTLSKKPNTHLSLFCLYCTSYFCVTLKRESRCLFLLLGLYADFGVPILEKKTLA